jgi:hypothetical protein
MGKETVGFFVNSAPHNANWSFGYLNKKIINCVENFLTFRPVFTDQSSYDMRVANILVRQLHRW